MRSKVSRAMPFAVGAMLLFGTGVEARQATPVAPSAVDPAGCTIAPRTPGELRELTLAGFETAAGFVRESQAGQGTPGAVASPVVEVPADGATPVAMAGEATPRTVGEPADEETVAAVEETVRQFAACTNAGDLFAQVSTFDDEGASGLLGFAVLAYAQLSAGDFQTVPTELDPAVLDAFFAARAIPVPPPAGQRFDLLDVQEVRRLEDGRVLATTALAFGGNEEAVDTLTLREEDGRYVILLGESAVVGGEATPVP